MPISEKSRGEGKKATVAQTTVRLNKIFDLLLSGYTRGQILQYVSDPKQDWGLSERQVDNYIKGANELIANAAHDYQANAFETALARLTNLYQACVRVQDFGQALQVQKEINKLLSLYRPPAPQTIRIEDVREQAVADIRAGRITYPALVEALNDTELANDLFRRAGIAVEVGQSAPSVTTDD